MRHRDQPLLHTAFLPPEVASRLSPLAHTALAAVSAMLQELGLPFTSREARAKALAAVLRLRPDLRPSAEDERRIVDLPEEAIVSKVDNTEAISMGDPDEAILMRLSELAAAGKPVTFAEDADGVQRPVLNKESLALLEQDRLGAHLLRERVLPQLRQKVATWSRPFWLRLQEVALEGAEKYRERPDLERVYDYLVRTQPQCAPTVQSAPTFELGIRALCARERLDRSKPADCRRAALALIRERPDLREPLDVLLEQEREQRKARAAEARRREDEFDWDAAIDEECERRGVARATANTRDPVALQRYRECVEAVAQKHKLRAARGR